MSVARDLFDLRMAGMYLPSLVLLILQPPIPWLNYVIGLSLLGAVYFHGLARNAFGVGGPEENPLERDESIENIQIALSGKGPREDLPSTLIGMVVFIFFNPLEYGLRPLLFMVVGAIAGIVWFPSMLASLYFAITRFDGLRTGEQLLIFAEFVWVSQWAVWRFYEPAYLIDESDFE